MLELIGLIIGLVIGLISPWTIPVQWSLYAACGLLAALDSALGGFRARIKGEFKLGVFLSGTIGNAFIAVFLAWLGQKLGLPLAFTTAPEGVAEKLMGKIPNLRPVKVYVRSPWE